MFIQTTVKYLGYVITTDRIYVDDERINEINNFKPKNLKQLRGFLDTLNYYNRFNLSDKCDPLYELLKRNIR